MLMHDVHPSELAPAGAAQLFDFEFYEAECMARRVG
jgi:hypothetical protein